MKYCLIGEKLSHSYSSDIHNKNGFNYELREVEEDALQEFVEKNDFDGYNVTIPYKERIIPFLDELSREAKAVGSVNTVGVKDGKKIGFNTDIYGAKLSFYYYKVRIKNKRVAIMGSGGTAKTFKYLCVLLGAKSVDIISRKGKINYQSCYDLLRDTQVLINATPVGTFPSIDENIVDLERFRRLQFVFDAVYNPLKTNLLLSAERLKIRNANGLLMLVAQAYYSERFWEDVSLDTDKLLRAFKDIKKAKLNVVLFGMASAGKSTIGKMVAEKLDKEFVDSDIEFLNTFNITPSDYILKYGESEFRKKEKDIIRHISTKKDSVIAVGGGSVLDCENVQNLARNGLLIQVKRRVKLLNAENRPLSNKYGVKRLYKQRKRVYNKVSCFSVCNNKGLDLAIDKVIKIYENSCH